MRVLVTGGAGYIGSHLVAALIEAGLDVVAVDDLSNGHPEAVRRAASLAGGSCPLIVGDIADRRLVGRALDGVKVVFHLAASKSVPESVEHPERYFRNNAGGTAALLEAMQDAGVSRLVYSSTAAVYGSAVEMPVTETSACQPDNPYGLSKLMGEQMLDRMAAEQGWSAVSLRYFNPVGAHASGDLGESFGNASSLVPVALSAVMGLRPHLTVFGSDYDTPDGTCLRDYVAISDLVEAHIHALRVRETGHHVFNVGTGMAHSVRDVLEACERVTGRRVPQRDGPRREGDVPVALADPSAMRDALQFEATTGLDEMVASAWRWHQAHPDGYGPKVRLATS